MSTRAARRRPETAAVSARVLRALLAAGLALTWQLAVPAPAHAVDDWRVEQPGAGAQVTGSATMVVAVSANTVEQIERVEARMLRDDGTQAGPVQGMSYRDGPTNAGTSRWKLPLDPFRSFAADGGIMRNGRYRLETRAHSSLEGTTGWRGHVVVFNVPPPKTSVTARTGRAPQTVEVSWASTQVPDFTRYILQRAAGSGQFSTIQELRNASATTFVDAVPSGGTWRYRVIVGRAGGEGGEVTSTSEPATVTVAAPAEEPRPSPSPTPSPSPSPKPPPDGGGDPGDGGDGDEPAGGGGDGGEQSPPPSGGGDGGGDGGGSDAGGNDSGNSRSGLTRRGSGNLGVPSGEAQRPPSVDAPQAAPPSSRPGPGTNVYEGPLDYGVAPRTEEVVETERVLVDEGGVTGGGMLTVFGGRQLQVEEVVKPVAAGLLFMIGAAHILRFRNS